MVRWVAVTLLVLLLLAGGYKFDVEQAFTYYGGNLVPSNPGLGVIIFLVLMAVVIFSEELFSFFKSVKKKIKLRKNF